jgi:multicomponent Na+:H+ antiporter subunit D
LIGVGPWLPRVLADAVATATSAAVCTAMSLLAARAGGATVVSWPGHWLPDALGGVGIALVADPFAAGLAALASALVTVALLYSWRYLRAEESHFHALVLLFLAGMIGFALSGDLFDMLVFFELMGAVAYGLAGYKIEEPRSVQGALTFGVINSLGAYCALTGIALLYAATGQLGLAPLGEALARAPVDRPPHGLVLAGFVLVGAGWLVKAAVVPFHFWLADAHAVAPSPVCVVFSGVMAELGLYGLARLYIVVFQPALRAEAVGRACLVLGMATAVLGALLCLLQRNVKRLLAYSTIAHMGLLLLTLRMFDASGSGGAAVYLLAHAGAKGALFLLAGVLLARYGTVDEASLHGRGRPHRTEGVLFGVAGLVLAGLPPSGSALGKGLAEHAVEQAGLPWAPWLFLAVSAITAAAVLRVGLRVYLGTGSAPRRAGDEEHTSGEDEKPETERPLGSAPLTMLTAIVLLLAGSLGIGLIPGLTSWIAEGAARFVDGAGYRASVLHGALPATIPPPDLSWTASAVWWGLSSSGLALLAGLGMAYRGPLSRVLGRGLHDRQHARLQALVGPAQAVLHSVERAHSGHIGDYVAWLLLGVAAFAVLLAAPV